MQIFVGHSGKDRISSGWPQLLYIAPHSLSCFLEDKDTVGDVIVSVHAARVGFHTFLCSSAEQPWRPPGNTRHRRHYTTIRESGIASGEDILEKTDACLDTMKQLLDFGSEWDEDTSPAPVVESIHRRLLESHRRMWNLIDSTNPASTQATKMNPEVRDQIGQLKNFQRRTADKQKLHEAYRGVEALLLPETWTYVKDEHLVGWEPEPAHSYELT
jgi:hypothetical protein